MNKRKEIDIKNLTYYYYFDDQIDIKNLNLSNIKVNGRSYNDVLIYYIMKHKLI